MVTRFFHISTLREIRHAEVDKLEIMKDARILSRLPVDWQMAFKLRSTHMPDAICIARQLLEREAVSPPSPSAQELEAIAEMVGLCFASGRFAELEVAWVPQLVLVQVHEYDGLERMTW